MTGALSRAQRQIQRWLQRARKGSQLTGMSDLEEAPDPPSVLSTVVGHLVIGLLVTALTKAIFRQKFVVAVVAGLLAFAVHQQFDAPVARKLTELSL